MWNLPLAQAQPQGTREFIDALARTPISKVLIFVAICTLVRVAIFPLLQRVPAHQRGGGYTLLKFLNEAIDSVVYAGVFVFMLIRPYCIQAFIIPSGSMVDTLLVNDFIVANKAVYRYSEPKQDDIVVFRPPVEATTPDQIDEKGEVKVDFIKRLIGVPGDVIEIKDNVLYRNGVLVKEPYVDYTAMDHLTVVKPSEIEFNNDFKLVKHKGQVWPLNLVNDSNMSAPKYHASDVELQELIDSKPIPVPKGYFLMMGDNRNGSFDGRAWGLVPRDSIIGRAEFIWLPIKRWRQLR
jgi:signal peptidase I